MYVCEYIHVCIKSTVIFDLYVGLCICVKVYYNHKCVCNQPDGYYYLIAIQCKD